MGDTAVLNIQGEPINPEPKQRKARETIRYIEALPQPDWFVQCKGPDGKTWWYLRIVVTGLRTRIYGPFETQHRALLFLDRNIGGDRCAAGFWECIMEADNRLNDYQAPEGLFQSRSGHYPLVENDLYLQQKGQLGMAKTMRLFEVCHDPKGEAPFKPLGGVMTHSKRKALNDLKTLRGKYPEAYLATVTYTRTEPEKKGR